MKKKKETEFSCPDCGRAYSCPVCGREYQNAQEVAEKIKERFTPRELSIKGEIAEQGYCENCGRANQGPYKVNNLSRCNKCKTNFSEQVGKVLRSWS